MEVTRIFLFTDIKFSICFASEITRYNGMLSGMCCS